MMLPDKAFPLPSSPQELVRAQQADLIGLPSNVKGTNCGNCRFFRASFCTHPEVAQRVSNRMCCALWDADGVYRSWKDAEFLGTHGDL